MAINLVVLVLLNTMSIKILFMCVKTDFEF